MLKNMFIFMLLSVITQTLWAVEAKWPEKTFYRYQEVNGHKMFYREAGHKKKGKPSILLLHGWPSSSHYFRELIPLLSGHYHVIAPDNLGSGYSDKPDPYTTTYSFELLAEQIDGLLKELELDNIVLYIHDFGAPVGLRTLVKRPKSVKGIIAQNGNAYIEGLGEGVKEFFQGQAESKSPEFADNFTTMGQDTIINAYLGNLQEGREDWQSPDAWTHDWLFFDDRSEQLIQMQLTQDYTSNFTQYPAWQKAISDNQLPVISIWGEGDAFFIKAGGKAYKRDAKKFTYSGLDAGHFALEEEPVVIAKSILKFMNKIK